jgi:NADH:ubiquinone oxidoreductase subunit 4 (subunit M)
MEEVKGGFQSVYTLFLIPSFPFSLKLGVDGISIFFILLTNIFIYLCILNLNVSTHKLREALIHLFFLQ